MMDEPMPDALYVAELLHKHVKGTITAEESVVLQTWAAGNDQRRQLLEDVNDAEVQQAAIKLIASYNEQEALERFMASHVYKDQPVLHERVYPLRPWKWIAAAVITLLAVAGYLFVSPPRHPVQLANNHVKVPDIAPGKNGAILKLADGSSIALDSLANGVVATQNGAQIVLNNGALIYDADKKANSETAYNIIMTPNGRQFRVSLPDGTQVWLNAASSIRYPTAFTGRRRNVEITGEVYFEVAPDAGMPFSVTILNNARIDVLGTHFNVNAYDNEDNQHTTLLEGAVKVVSLKDNASALYRNGIILQPGQQLRMKEIPDMINHVDIDKVMAWKNGLFDFDGMDVKYAMKQIARWYDVEIIYRDEIPDIKFYGKISRNISLEGLIKGLSGTGVHLHLEEGKRLVVTK
ncbi:MAG: FecR domain-containing protein [Chitinophaga sp.]|uniref:FecR family protein n=1 Tax=Chitinophaga sp. TaxID=1869181 RepID=UPI001B050EA9|nr:FecR family protein [Chitinophaga sp.]MBO9729814.1 FecR domain-containing protein [Chitinophaga sp.]